MLLDVTEVEVLPDYVLLLQFENGEKRRFDLSPYMDKKPFARLRNQRAFGHAFVENGTLVWPGNIDIAPETLYDLSLPLTKPVRKEHPNKTLSMESNL
jgi:hypothetical protein